MSILENNSDRASIDGVEHAPRKGVDPVVIASFLITAGMRNRIKPFLRNGTLSDAALYSMAFRFVNDGDKAKLDSLERLFPDWDIPRDIVRATIDPAAEYYDFLEYDGLDTQKHLPSAVELGIAEEVEQFLQA